MESSYESDALFLDSPDASRGKARTIDWHYALDRPLYAFKIGSVKETDREALAD